MFSISTDTAESIRCTLPILRLTASPSRSRAGGDTLVGSPFNDVIDSGLGSDFVTGGLGLDSFFDNSPASDIDTLIETFNDDIGLFNNTLIVGTLLDENGTKVFEIGKSPANELTDPGDRWAAGATVEDLKDIFEKAEIDGGTGNNTIVVNDLDNLIKVGATTRNVTSWRGKAKLDNKGNDTAHQEHYLITVRPSDVSQIHIRDSADQKDRLVVVGSAEGDWITVGTTTATFYDDDAGTLGTVAITGDRDVHVATITHKGVEFVEINTREGDDRLAVRAIFTETRINTSVGDDIINIGSNANIGGRSENTGGVLDDINAPLIVNGQGNNDHDVVNLDDSGDDDDNDATLTADSLTNGIKDADSPSGRTEVLLFGEDGRLTYNAFEELPHNREHSRRSVHHNGHQRGRRRPVQHRADRRTDDDHHG